VALKWLKLLLRMTPKTPASSEQSSDERDQDLVERVAAGIALNKNPPR
jgi:hypothetical protein